MGCFASKPQQPHTEPQEQQPPQGQQQNVQRRSIHAHDPGHSRGSSEVPASPPPAAADQQQQQPGGKEGLKEEQAQEQEPARGRTSERRERPSASPPQVVRMMHSCSSIPEH